VILDELYSAPPTNIVHNNNNNEESGSDSVASDDALPAESLNMLLPNHLRKEIKKIKAKPPIPSPERTTRAEKKEPEKKIDNGPVSPNLHRRIKKIQASSNTKPYCFNNLFG